MHLKYCNLYTGWLLILHYKYKCRINCNIIINLKFLHLYTGWLLILHMKKINMGQIKSGDIINIIKM
jgi:hypothetical protein